MKVDRIDKIIDPEFKSGTTEKNGKKFTWRLVKAQIGNKEATGFGPVVEGDPVKLTFNSQYNNWKFEVLSGDDLPTYDIDDDKPESEPAPQTSDERGDAITASMTTKLAYHGFIQTESVLPRDKKEWGVVQEQATKLYEVIQAVKSGQKAPKLSGRDQAKATADRIGGRNVTEDLSEEIPDFEEEE